jgi:AbrB family looped-hinge helix DNA binding protein
MAKVTSKLQVTIPKAIAERYEIAPGDELEWIPADDAVRVVPAKLLQRTLPSGERLELFDAATKRQRERERSQPAAALSPPAARGWTRAELYDRGQPR